jgi:hypothetical protein
MPLLRTLSPVFEKIYSSIGGGRFHRNGCCAVCSFKCSLPCERMMMAQLDDNRLYRRFVGLNMNDPTWT